MNSEEAENRGYTHLSSYLEQVGKLMEKNMEQRKCLLKEELTTIEH